MLVFYSLGNFLSYQKEAPRMLGGMANFGVYKLSEYPPEMAKKHGVSDIAVQGDFTYNDTLRLAKKNSWGMV